MSKKSFSGGLNSLFESEKTTKKVGRPKSHKEVNISSQQGTLPGETRATIIINEQLLDKIKAVAYWDRELVKETISKAIGDYLEKRKPKPRPIEARKKEQDSAQRLIKTPGNKARLPEY